MSVPQIEAIDIYFIKRYKTYFLAFQTKLDQGCDLDSL